MLISVIYTGVGSERIDGVFDVYRQLSINGAQRAMRGLQTGISFTHIISGHKIQQWRRHINQLYRRPMGGKPCMREKMSFKNVCHM